MEPRLLVICNDLVGFSRWRQLRRGISYTGAAHALAGERAQDISRPYLSNRSALKVLMSQHVMSNSVRFVSSMPSFQPDSTTPSRPQTSFSFI